MRGLRREKAGVSAGPLDKTLCGAYARSTTIIEKTL